MSHRPPGSDPLTHETRFAKTADGVFLAYQVVVPFLMIVWTSFKTARPGEPEFLEFTFTLANYIRAFDSPSFWRTTTNTLTFALASTLLAFVIGAFIAWVVERTNTPLKPLAYLTAIVSLGTPYILYVGASMHMSSTTDAMCSV